MGAFDVETERGKKDTKLVRFETRNTARDFEDPKIVRYPRRGGGLIPIKQQPAKYWVRYARELFRYAAEKRERRTVEDDPTTPKNEAEKTTLIYDEPEPETNLEPTSEEVPDADFEGLGKLTLKLGDETKPGFDAEFRLFLPTLLDDKLKPHVFAGAGTGGLSAGVGASSDPITDMSLFLGGKVGFRSDWFNSIEVGGGVEAGWAFDESRSLRLGIGWEMWQQLGSDEKRTHLLNLFLSKSF